jgi:hypothetical protein
MKILERRCNAAMEMQKADAMTWKYQRRTTTGNGRTKKPGLHGAVKNPRLLEACITSEEESDMIKFFVIVWILILFN